MSDLLTTIAEHIPASKDELEAIIRTACYRYKVYTVPKRSGTGVRTIAQPSPEVKWIQRVVVEKIIEDWPIHKAATAYRKNSSTADHALRHAKSRFLLKLDFTDFFPSIGAADVAQHVRNHTSLSADDQRRLVTLLTWRNKTTGLQCLSIGAPSSPFVSNSMLYEFDLSVEKFCCGVEVSYSRYADDLAFSTAHSGVLKDVLQYVEQTLETVRYPHLALNTSKTVNVSKRHHRSLVGLVLTPDGKISIGRDKKRLLRAQIHRFSHGLLPPQDEASLRGMLAYVMSVEPRFLNRLLEHCGQATMARLGISSEAVGRRPG